MLDASRALAFPTFLKPAFDAEELTRSDSTIAVIDTRSDILWVNHAWHRFAKDNDGGDRIQKFTSYLDGIAPPLRDYYRAVFANTFASGEPFEQDYECSTPERRRTYRLRALPFDHDGLLLEHTLVAESELGDESSNPALEATYLDDRGVISQCSNCRRIRRPKPQAWHWIASWVKTPHPRTSHVICGTCAGFYWGRPRGRRQR